MIRCLLYLALAAGSVSVSLQSAEVRQGVAGNNVNAVTFQSNSLGEQRAFNILLPPDYDKASRRYPCLYLLHGLGDDHTAWSLMTNLSGYAVGQQMIIVMPDAGRSFYVNSASDPKARFEDFVVKDLIPYVDSHYRTIPLRRARAVAGLSMGGYGAAFLGLKNFQRFASIGTFSGALGISRPTPTGDVKTLSEWNKLFGPPKSPQRTERDPFALVEKVPMSQMPDIYIACGGQDFLIDSNREFVKLLAEKKIPYEYREISPRVHSWDFWDDNIKIYLKHLSTLEGWR